MRLVLLSGTGGAGVSTVARIQSTALDAPLIRLETFGAAERSRHREATSALIGSVLPGQVDPSPLWEGGAAPLVDDALGWLDILDGLARGPVVVDAGPIPSLRRMLGTPDAVLAMLDSVMTPNFAAAHAPADTSATMGVQPLEWLHDAMRRANAAVATGVLRLVTEPDRADEALEILPLAALHNLALDAVIVNKVPRGREDWPRRWAKERRAAAKALRHRIAPIPSPRLPLGHVASLEAALWEQLPSMPSAPAMQPGEPGERDGRWHWYLAMPDPLAQEVRVGRIDDRLLVEVGGQRRLLALPSVLRRCVPELAEADSRGLLVHFRPDPEQWPTP